MVRFRDEAIVFANGSIGTHIEVPSTSPKNYYQVLSQPDQMPSITIDGKLFLPPGMGEPVAAVIVAPGSLGVAQSHLKHAEVLTNLGIAAFVVDSFGERSIRSTVADQTQFSFAASAYDILASWQVLAQMPEIDKQWIGAQGHSRGGSAVLTAANRRFANAVVGVESGLTAVLAAYPWCGHQFLDPDVGLTEILVLMGDRDGWCSPMQAQAHCQSIRLAGGNARMQLFKDARHSFDRGTAIENVPDARISPSAPTVYIANDGAMIHPLEEKPDANLMDRDLMVYALKAGYGVIGAEIGSVAGEAERFNQSMIDFWQHALS